MTVCIDFQKYKNVLNERDGIEVSGSIDRIVGLVAEEMDQVQARNGLLQI